ncbi:MAG: hypothetical protein P8080_10455, partial [Gammaproteobacteria bacterium]
MLVHGLWRGKSSMWLLARRLEDAGFDVFRADYDSLTATTGEIVRQVHVDAGNGDVVGRNQLARTGKGKIVRRRSVEHVMRELHQIKAEGCRFIRCMDDLFILYPEWVKEFATRYREEIGLPFSCLVRANLVTEEIVA